MEKTEFALSTFRGHTFDGMIESLGVAFGAFDAEMAAHGRSFDWCIDVAIGRTATVLTGYHSEEFSFNVNATCGTGSYLSLCMPSAGGMGVKTQSQDWTTDEGGMLFYSNLAPDSVSFLGERNKVTEILLPSDSLVDKMQDLGIAGDHLAADFIQKLSRKTEGYNQIRGISQLLIDGVKENGPLLECPLAFDGLVQALGDVLVTELTKDSRLARSGKETRAAPIYVRRAQEYLHCNIAKPVSISKMAAELGVSTRSLELGFRSFLQQSPIAYLQRIRMEAARTALLNPESRAPVKSICLSWGFHNFGRFSALYKKQYGESPSETIKRVRN